MNKEAKLHLSAARRAYYSDAHPEARRQYGLAILAAGDRDSERIRKEFHGRSWKVSRDFSEQRNVAASSAAILATAKKNTQREKARKARERKKSPDGMTASERAMANSEPRIAPRNKPEPDDKPLYISRSWTFAFANGVYVAVQSRAMLLETEQRMILGLRPDQVSSSSKAVAIASAILDKVPAASRVEISFHYTNMLTGDFGSPVDSRTVIAVQR